jgi:hypothetical protein
MHGTHDPMQVRTLRLSAASLRNTRVRRIAALPRRIVNLMTPDLRLSATYDILHAVILFFSNELLF